MISISQLASIVENGLNNYGTKEFRVFADVNDYQEAYRQQINGGFGSNTIHRAINGIMEAMIPDIIPVKNCKIITQNVEVTFAFDVDLLEKDSKGNYKQVEEAKAIINNWGMSVNGTQITNVKDEEDNSYPEITISYGGCVVGMVSQLSPVGDVLPVSMQLTFIIIQGGINTNSVKILLNGEELVIQGATIDRVRTSETNTYSDEDTTKSVVQSNGISIGLSTPFINTEQNKMIESDILNGSMNKAQLVEYVRGISQYRPYIMVLVNENMSLAPSKNIGFDYNLAEGVFDLMDFGFEQIRTSEVTIDNPIGQVGGIIENVTFDNKHTYKVDWGDGKVEYYNTQTSISSISHTYYENGTYKITIYRSTSWRIYEQQTTDSGTTHSITIQLGLTTPKTIVAFWGDGTFSKTQNESVYITHDYAKSGTYRIIYYVY